jgi:hypothetical protein
MEVTMHIPGRTKETINQGQPTVPTEVLSGHFKNKTEPTGLVLLEYNVCTTSKYNDR